MNVSMQGQRRKSRKSYYLRMMKNKDTITLEDDGDMKILESMEQFSTLINKEPVITMFSADWCPDCRAIEPVLPEIEEAYSDYTFIEIDRDQFIDLCQDYGIFGIPSFLAFRNGKEIGRFVSKDRKTKEEIMTFIDELPNQA